jgi:glutaredoxin
VDYRNVKTVPGLLEEMLKATGGKREVPAIIENGKLTIGFNGGS